MNPRLHNVADLERIDALADDLATAIRRNKELEAEVERLGTLLENREADIEYWRSRARGYRACAEKAEAEVERLQTERDMYEALWRKHAGVNPSGDQSLLSQKPRENDCPHGIENSGRGGQFFCFLCHPELDEPPARKERASSD